MEPISPGRRGGLTWLALVLLVLAFVPLVDGPRTDAAYDAPPVQCQPVVDLGDEVPDDEQLDSSSDVPGLTGDDVVHESAVTSLPTPVDPDPASEDYETQSAEASGVENLTRTAATCDRERTQQVALTVLLLVPVLLLCCYVMVVPTARQRGAQRPGADLRRAEEDRPAGPGSA